jgi:tRNA-modifying protein YgfZ
VSLADDLTLLRQSVGGAVLRRDVVRVSGAEAVGYLQGQLSQDVAALPVGASSPSFVLQPQGKVDVWMRVTRTADAEFLLDTEPGWGERLVERLARFKLRTAVELELLDWSMVSLRGPDAVAPADGVVVEAPGGFDLLGPAPEVPEGVASVDPTAIEVLRIEARIPAMGAEIDETTIPAETGVVDASVSFTKGCYTGQELVARVDSRGGRAPRRIVGLRLATAQVPRGTGLALDGNDVGRITSVADDGRGGAVALGLLARAVDTPITVELAGGGTAEVLAET